MCFPDFPAFPGFSRLLGPSLKSGGAPFASQYNLNLAREARESGQVSRLWPRHALGICRDEMQQPPLIASQTLLRGMAAAKVLRNGLKLDLVEATCHIDVCGSWCNLYPKVDILGIHQIASGADSPNEA